MAEIQFQFDHQPVALSDLLEHANDELLRVVLEHLLAALNSPTANAFCSVHKQTPSVTVALTATGELNVVITNCCQTFAERKTAPLHISTNRFQTAHFRPDLKLILNVQGDQRPFVFDAHDIETLKLGRADRQTDNPPDIDLQPYDAVEKGVSRWHASIVWVEGALHLVDNTSSNGTYLDERRLEAQQPYMLHDGDTIRLGDLVLEVRLADTTATGPLQTALL